MCGCAGQASSEACIHEVQALKAQFLACGDTITEAEMGFLSRVCRAMLCRAMLCRGASAAGITVSKCLETPDP